jgi:hypothetical protein
VPRIGFVVATRRAARPSRTAGAGRFGRAEVQGLLTTACCWRLPKPGRARGTLAAGTDRDAAATP